MTQYLKRGLSEKENKMIMMRDGVDFVRNASLMLNSHHVGLYLIQIARIVSLQKISRMRKCGCHNQVQDLIRNSVPCKLISVLKANKLHLELCFVELENAYQKMNVLPGTKMLTCFFKKMRGQTWVKETLKPATEHLKRFVLFADNLTGQLHDEFKESVSDRSGVVWYGLPNATDLWQPVDAGYARMLKTLMEQEQHKYLVDEEYADRWYGNEEPYSAKKRRMGR